MQQQMPPKGLNVDVSAIPDMKCWCGNDIFIKVRKLKFISPLIMGDPKGGTWETFLFMCLACKTMYPSAIDQKEVERYRPKMANGPKRPPFPIKANLKK